MPASAPGIKLKVKGNKTFRPFSTLEDEDALIRTWKATSKVCGDLEDGERLENLSWRLWGMHSNDSRISSQGIIDSKPKYKSQESPLVLRSRRVGEKLNSEKSTPIEQLVAPVYVSRLTTFKIRNRNTTSSEAGSLSQAKKKLWITTPGEDVVMDMDGDDAVDDIDEDMLDYERFSRGQSLSTNPSRASSPARFEDEELPHPDCAGANGLPGPCKVPGCTAFGPTPAPTLSNGALGLDTSVSSPPLLQKLSSDRSKNNLDHSSNSPSSSRRKIEDFLQQGSKSSAASSSPSHGQTPIPFDELLRQFVASNGGNVSAEDPLGLGTDTFDVDDCPFAAAAVAMSNSPQGNEDGNEGSRSSSRNILQLPLCCQQRASASASSPEKGDTTPTRRCCADEKVKEIQRGNSPSRATTASEQLTADLAKMLRNTSGSIEADSKQQLPDPMSQQSTEAAANFAVGFDPRQQLAHWLSQQQKPGSVTGPGSTSGTIGSGLPLWPTTAHLMQGQSPMSVSTPALNSPAPLSVPGTPLSTTSYFQPLPPGCAFASSSSASMGPPSEPITPTSGGPDSNYSSSNKGKRRADEFVPLCSHCGTSSTPLWRRDSKRRVVCNKCGLRSAKRANTTGSTGEAADGDKVTSEGDGDGNLDGTREEPPICNNCGTKITSLWRKDEEGLRSCNPCGLWLKHHGFPRPLTKRTDVVKRRMRHHDLPHSPPAKEDDGDDDNDKGEDIDKDKDNDNEAVIHSHRSSISVPQDSINLLTRNQQIQDQTPTPCALNTLSQPPPYPSHPSQQTTTMNQQYSSQGHQMTSNHPLPASTWAPPPYPQQQQPILHQQQQQQPILHQQQQQPQGQSGLIKDPAQAAAGAYLYFQATGTWPPGWVEQMQHLQAQNQPQSQAHLQQQSHYQQIQFPQGWNPPQASGSSLPPHLQHLHPHLQVQAHSMPPPASPGFQQQHSPASHQSWQYPKDTHSHPLAYPKPINPIGQPIQGQNQSHSFPPSASSNHTSPSNANSTFNSPVGSPAASAPNSTNAGPKKTRSKVTRSSGSNAAKGAGSTGRSRGRPAGGAGAVTAKKKKVVVNLEETPKAAKTEGGG